MDMKAAISAVIEGRDLTTREMQSIMKLIMNGEATPAQIGGLLVGLRLKGETVDEFVGAVSVMRELSTKVMVNDGPLIDTCGTGGSGLQVFNVSTASAFVVAAAGARVAKHGNRGISSQSGSADVLEAAAIPITLSADQVASCINDVGVGFMFAPNHHSAVKHVVGPRRELGVRTLFNLLGPITNPANTPHQLLGLFDKRFARAIAQTLHRLGSKHVLIVHGDDGLDEISLATDTAVTELKNGDISEYKINPKQFGLAQQSLDSLIVKSPEDSLVLIKKALNNEGPPADMVSINAGAAIYAADLANDLESGVSKARSLLENGQAYRKFKELQDYCISRF